MTTSTRLSLIIPAGFVLLTAVLSLGGVLAPFEHAVFDIFLQARPAPKEHKELLLVEMDDGAISEIGTWPISRSIMADMLVLMKELGARYAVFDIEYLNKSPRGVNAEVLTHELPDAVDSTTGSIELQARQLFNAIATGQLSVRDAADYVDELGDYIKSNRDTLKARLGQVALDNDLYLAQAVRLFDTAYLTVNMQDAVDSAVLEADRQKAIQLHARTALVQDLAGMPKKVEIAPVISPILEAARGIGFTNVVVDPDGVRRRARLIQRYGDAYFAQLATSPLLDWLGRPQVVIHDGSLTLKGATLPDGTKKDIHIPFSEDRTVLIDWPHSRYEESFRHLSMGNLYVHNKFYDDLVSNLRQRDTWGYLQLFQGETPLLETADQAAALRAALMAGDESPALITELRALKDRFLADTGAFLAARPEDEITSQLRGILDAGGLNAAEKAQYETILKDAPDYFAKTRSLYEGLMKQRELLAKALEGSFAILGQTNTGSTDIGATPFDSEYKNVGTHASIVNMILNGNFIVDAHPAWSLALALVLSLGLAWFSRNLKSLHSILAGAGLSVAVIVGFMMVFSLTGLYVPTFTLAVPIILSFITVTFLKFMVSEKEKGFLRSAFSHYLSDAVIKQIVADPSKLQLGGQQKFMTAMFTDIKGFSTVSEKMTPTELVALLNRYLTGMSDLILDAGGTIDKYEGDAIIAFFGAPLDVPDHARRACITAVRMKQAEAELNRQFMAEGIAPNPLLTRIGINTGDMVVGNMGTLKKMDYTIIGDAVNLAARLEGVNKQYGTWICVSEDTVKAAADAVVFRKLDRIRVVGKSVPIRIFDILGETGHLPESVESMLAVFHDALDLFEARKWTEAAATFQSCLDLVPDDGPSLRYLKKCKEYQTTPPPEKWDGIFTLDMK